jgi:type I restriction enzyme S subunit
VKMTTSASRRATIREVTLINAHSIKGSSAPSHIEYIDISSVGTGEFTEPPALMSFEDAPSRARRIVKAGDTIISTVRPNRRSFLFLSSPSSIAVASTGFAVLTPTPAVDPRYLYYWVTRQDFTDYLSLHAKGAAYPAVSAEDIGNGAIDLPPLPIQHRIAGILSAYDELIENSQRRIKILEAMARALYREWFVHFRFPGHESVPRVPSPLGEIPQGWEVTSLGSLVEIRKGKNITKDTIREGSVPVVAGGIAPAYFHDTPNTQSPVITISASGANAGFVNLYYVDVWASDCSFIDQSATPHVYYYYLWLDHRRAAVTHLQRGSAQPHVYPKDLAQLEAVNVPKDLLDAFTSQIEPVFGVTMRMAAKVENLRRTRDLLLPRLLSGQIDVEAMPA